MLGKSSKILRILTLFIFIYTVTAKIQRTNPKTPTPGKAEPAAATATRPATAAASASEPLPTLTPVAATNSDWWHHAVFYQIYIRSFKDSSGDGIGDIKGVIDKLPYLADLGINAIWLAPIFQSPMIDDGYDVSDFKAIQQEYGTMEDFEILIAEANKLNIKVLIDFIPNHSSDQCLWFKNSVERVKDYEDFYIWADAKYDDNGERIPPNNWQSVYYGSAWTWNEKRQQYYLHQFAKEQPDLNLRNQHVVDALDEIFRFWLEKGVSGFRIDSVNHLFESAELLDEPLSGDTNDKKAYNYTLHIYTKDLPDCYEMVQHWRNIIDDYCSRRGGPARILLTEAYSDFKKTAEYYTNRTGLLRAHLPFNFLLITDVNIKSEASDFVLAIEKWLTYTPRGFVPNWIIGNHDNPRVASRFNPKSVDALNMLLMTLPGVAFTYYGEEIGMEDFREMPFEDCKDPVALNIGKDFYKDFGRDPIRTPFQWDESSNAGFTTAKKSWLPTHPNFKTVNVNKESGKEKSHLKVYKQLVELKKRPVMRVGKFEIYVLNPDTFAYKRTLAGHAPVLTIINLGDKEQIINITDLVDAHTKASVLISGVQSKYEKGAKLEFNNVRVPPFDGLICMLE